jgi:hypothetical protein
MRIIFAIVLFLNTTASLPAFLGPHKQGAYIEVQKQDGAIIKGELLAVRRNMIIIQVSSYGSYEFIDLSDIALLQIQKKSRLLGASLGFLRGSITGTVIGDLSATSISHRTKKRTITIMGGAVGGLIGALFGHSKGTPVNKSETYIFKGKSQVEISAILSEINSKARIRD